MRDFARSRRRAARLGRSPAFERAYVLAALPIAGAFMYGFASQLLLVG